MTITSAYPDLSIDRGSDTLNVSVATIGTSAAVLVAANTKRRYVKVRNTHATQTVYLGHDASVTGASDGFELTTNSAEIIQLDTTAAIYAIASGVGTTVEIMEVSHG